MVIFLCFDSWEMLWICKLLGSIFSTGGNLLIKCHVTSYIHVNLVGLCLSCNIGLVFQGSVFLPKLDIQRPIAEGLNNRWNLKNVADRMKQLDNVYWESAVSSFQFTVYRAHDCLIHVFMYCTCLSAPSYWSWTAWNDSQIWEYGHNISKKENISEEFDFLWALES